MRGRFQCFLLQNKPPRFDFAEMIVCVSGVKKVKEERERWCVASPAQGGWPL